jgi:RHH-type transcriptional regulator, rel operon repressor / antitoxin RelB
MAEPTTRMTVDLPASVKERLEELARTTARPEALLVTDAISSYVELQEWQIEEIRKGLQEATRGEFATDQEVAAVFSKWKNAS